MQDAALFFRSRAVAAFHRRRKYALLSDDWRHYVAEARRFIRACRTMIAFRHPDNGTVAICGEPFTRREQRARRAARGI